MKNKKMFKISIILLIVGFVCLIVPAIIMMTEFKNEPEGEHILLSILLGIGTGLLIATSVFSFCSERKNKKLTRADK
jgi:nitrate reductase gamma subunit